MKKLLLFIFCICSLGIFAQAPQKMSYQAIIRDASNSLLQQKQIGMQISVLQGTITGTAVYIETQTATTNTNGLVGLEIGTGTATTGTFTGIDWANGPFFIKTETDPNGGSTYTISGTSQLMSVPYALYAATSGSSTAGPKGDTGDKGDAGTNGTDGIKGDTGAKGDAGTNGTDGAKGDTGGKGDAGTNGTNGAKGDTGAKGDSGANGTDGAKGDTGAKGDAGSNGTNGAKGDTGAKGDAGTNGTDGTKGDTGAKGDAGTNGTDGVKGDSGITGEILTSIDVYGYKNTLYYSIAGKQSTDENRGAIVAPRSGTISKLYVLPNKVTVAGSSVTVTLRVNGADTALTATSVEGSAAVFSDLIHSKAISAGDIITFKIQETKGVTTSANYTASAEFK
jgi:hypothetical protein